MSKIILKNVGRGKINRTIEIPDGKDEEALAEIAYQEVCKHLMSRGVNLDLNNEKGAGHWKVYVGMSSHVGDVEIIV